MSFPFPTVIDNSMLSQWRKCPRRFFEAYILHHAPNLPSIHLHAGAAFASGLETTRRAYYADGLPEEEAIQKGFQAVVKAYGDFTPTDNNLKTVSRMSGALIHYFKNWPLCLDRYKPAQLGDRLGIEFSFLIPLDIFHPITNDPLLYYGRFDLIAQHDETLQLWGVDDKTASKLGKSWHDAYTFPAQFLGYICGARRVGIDLAGFKIRGLSVLKDAYGCAEHTLYTNPTLVNRWWDSVHAQIEEIIHQWHQHDFPYNMDSGCTAYYTRCPFMDLCLSSSETYEQIIKTDFYHREYNPAFRQVDYKAPADKAPDDESPTLDDLLSL